MLGGSLGFDDQEFYRVYGQFVGMVFLLPIFGAILCDRFLSHKTGFLVGGGLALLGMMSLFVPNHRVILGGLSLVASGTAVMRPNILALIASRFQLDPCAQNSNFTLTGLSTVIGSGLGTLICLVLSEKVSPFAGITMAICALMTSLGLCHRDKLSVSGHRPSKAALTIVSTVLLVCGLALSQVFLHPELNDIEWLWNSTITEILAGLVGVLSLIWFVTQILRSSGQVSRNLGVLLLTTPLAVLFRSISELAGPTIAQLNNGNPTFNPIFQLTSQLVAGGILLGLWFRFSGQKKFSPVFSKFGLAFLTLGISLLLLSFTTTPSLYLGFFCLLASEIAIFSIGDAAIATLGAPTSKATSFAAWYGLVMVAKMAFTAASHESNLSILSLGRIGILTIALAGLWTALGPKIQTWRLRES